MPLAVKVEEEEDFATCKIPTPPPFHIVNQFSYANRPLVLPGRNRHEARRLSRAPSFDSYGEYERATPSGNNLVYKGKLISIIILLLRRPL